MRKRGGIIWIVTGIILALLAGAVAFWAIYRASSKVAPVVQEVPKAKVIVASRHIAVRELIQAGDVETRQAPLDIIPENAMHEMSNVVGYLALNPLSPGEIILASDLLSPTLKSERIAMAMDKNQVAFAFPADDLMSSCDLLQPGDHVDLLFSIEVKLSEKGDKDLTTFTALQNVEIAQIVRPQVAGSRTQGAHPTAIVFALDPQDALVLKHLRNRGGTVDIVLRAPDAKQPFSTQPVNEDYLINRYQLRIPMLP